MKASAVLSALTMAVIAIAAPGDIEARGVNPKNCNKDCGTGRVLVCDPKGLLGICGILGSCCSCCSITQGGLVNLGACV
ncbi:hypothetical protein V3481_012512 [Fusarium oxysporum f. sp. vasinfectum]|uniref:Uncharacterized protein n=1 Tax=Fusarium oxysporum f. sp. vasinfectum 25433 TaxID=1089449 RepID=X0L0H4_FUSOX|nr:hypothetical protein FOTG_17032 [Fusarium oxysporum f. sp. vasinfectum 25433]